MLRDAGYFACAAMMSRVDTVGQSRLQGLSGNGI